MLHRYEAVLHLLGLLFCSLQHPVGILGDVELVRLPASGDPGEFVQLGVHRRIQALHRNAHFLQQLGSQSPLLPQKRRQQMHLLHLLILVAYHNLLCQLHSLQRFLRVISKLHNQHFLSPFSTLAL